MIHFSELSIRLPEGVSYKLDLIFLYFHEVLNMCTYNIPTYVQYIKDLYF
jgi:hypothetical protein